MCGQDSFQLLLKTENAHVFFYISAGDVMCAHISHVLKSLDQKSVLIFYERIYMRIIMKQSETEAL